MISRNTAGGAVAAVVAAIFTLGAGDAEGEEARQDGKDWSYTLGVGAIYAPDYVGSDDFTVTAFPVLRIQKETFYVETDGPGLRANVMAHDLFEFGPIVRYGEGRSDVEDDAVDALPEIDNEIWAGLFIGYTHKGLTGERDSLTFEAEFVTDVSGNNGAIAELGVTYGFRATQRLALSVGASTTYADREYADTFFSVTETGAAASGLSTYTADSGVRDVGLSASARYSITPRANVLAITGVSRLLGDFADSPIVDERGSATQVSGGLILTYTF